MTPLTPPTPFRVLEALHTNADLPLYAELARALGGRVLELGCGSGRVAKYLADHGITVHGIDRDPSAVEEARRRVPAGRFFVEDVGRMRRPERYEVVLAPSLFEHIIDESEFVEMLATVRHHVCPGGQALLRTATRHYPTRLARPRVRRGVVDGWAVTERITLAAVDDTTVRLVADTHLDPPALAPMAAPVDRREERLIRRWDGRTIERLVDGAGLTVRERWGGFDRRPAVKDDLYRVWLLGRVGQ